MAATVAASRLTEAHRLAQARIGAQTVAAMRTIWPLLDVGNLDRSFDRWLTAALTVIRGQRVTSARLAANYLSTFKALEVGGTAPVVLAETAPADAVATSLLVTGPVQIRRALGNGLLFTRAVATAEATTAASAMRHVLNGGRETIAETVRADRQALGWARATSGRACAFCAMLASRGPVYSERSVAFEAHDHCSCNAEPVYRRDAAWPAGSDRFASLWAEAKAADGDTTVNFRRLIEAA